VNNLVDEEQKEAILDMMATDGFDVLMEIVLPEILKDQAQRVLFAKPTELAYEQAKYQGMNAFVRKLSGLKDQLSK
jgi:hypothetical protein